MVRAIKRARYLALLPFTVDDARELNKPTMAQGAIGLTETRGLVGVIEVADAAAKAGLADLLAFEQVGGGPAVRFSGDVAAVQVAGGRRSSGPADWRGHMPQRNAVTPRRSPVHAVASQPAIKS